MTKIKAIAFDLGGVLIKENDFLLSSIEELLESKFGKLNTDSEYIQRAITTNGLSGKDITKSIKRIISNIYELRDPKIFSKIPKLKLAIASNHLSFIHELLDKLGIKKYFDVILISADIGIEKPDLRFYERLIYELKELPENILFVDDDSANINAAKKMRIKTLHYNRSKDLVKEIMGKLE